MADVGPAREALAEGVLEDAGVVVDHVVAFQRVAFAFRLETAVAHAHLQAKVAPAAITVGVVQVVQIAAVGSLPAGQLLL